MARFISCLILTFLAVSLPVGAIALDRGLRVLDGDTFEMQGETIRLFGIDAPERGQPCDRAGSSWDCGAWARKVLLSSLEQGPLNCKAKDIDRYGRTVAQCWVDGKDLGKTMVLTGAAIAYTRYSSLYVGAEREARRAERGIWAARLQDPEAYRHSALADPKTAPAAATSSCVIKGNISSKGEKIYHHPGQRHYEETRISPTKGEAWFCTEADAKAAGFRAARR